MLPNLLLHLLLAAYFLNIKMLFVYLLPTCKMAARDLNVMLKKIIVSLEDIGLGFRVIAVITDNNFINRRTTSYFVFPPKLSITFIITFIIKADHFF